MVRLQAEAIDYPTLTEGVRSTACGAVVLFLGTVREFTGGQRTLALTYEAYASMAERELAKIEAELRQRWPVQGVALVHRLGRLELGEISVAVAVSAPHRADAFDAARHAMERIKESVPIWKQDHAAEGTAHWVHPG